MPVLISQLEEYKALARKIYHSDKESINLSTKSKTQIGSIRKIIAANKASFNPEVFQDLAERFSELLDDSSYSHLKKFTESTIRASSIDCEKEIDFDIQGSHFVISEGILSFIKDSMVHILRNSVDHGIEQAEERQQVGKNPVGKINVNILPTDKFLKIEIIDDGAGIDFKKIKEKAIALRFLKNVDAEKVTHDQLTNILFSPGFTTKDHVTETSGRGVGLDAARENVEKIGGWVEVESVSGMGTTFKLLYPLEGVIQLLSARSN
jgi:two-component system chemotaxis sensor kinase CheA